MPSYTGPHKIISRPTQSTIKVKVGTFVNGAENLQVHHWSNLKPATVREDTPEAEMPKRGRPAKTSPPTEVRSSTESAAANEGARKEKRQKVNNPPTRWSERLRNKSHETSSLECQQPTSNPRDAGNSNLASQQVASLTSRPWSASKTEIQNLNFLLQQGYRRP